MADIGNFIKLILTLINNFIMKKILLFIAIAVAAIACKKDETPVTPEIKVLSTAYELAVPYEVSDLTIKIESTVDWTAEFKDAASAEVCDFTPKSGVAGAATIAVTFEANADKVDREAVIVITAGTATAEVKVTQGLKVVANPAEPAAIPVAGGSVNVTIESNTEYVVTPATNDWLTVTNDGDVYTFTATANAAFNGRSVEVVVAPTNEAYADYATSFVIAQDGTAVKLWTKNPTIDFEGYDATKKVRLAKYGNYILVANTTKVYALNPLDGTVAQTFNFPDGMAAPSFCVDDADNIIVATDCAYGGTMGIYSIADPTNPNPVLIKDWNTGNYYGTNVGNLRVKGNINEKAVMTALVAAGAGGAGLMWKFENGECTTWYGVNVPKQVNGCEYGCIAPLGNTFEAGFLHIGYEEYTLKYLANPILDNYTENSWADVYTTGYSWMENINCISTAEYKGHKYAAITAGCHFNYDAADALLIDITNIAAGELVYTYNGDGDVARDGSYANLNWTGGGTYSDILLVPTEEALLMVYIDTNYNAMSCIALK